MAEPTSAYVYGPEPPVTRPTSVSLTVSSVLIGSEPVTVPAARSAPSLFRSSAFSYTFASASVATVRPASFTPIVSVVVDWSPSPSVIVYTNTSLAPTGIVWLAWAL